MIEAQMRFYYNLVLGACEAWDDATFGGFEDANWTGQFTIEVCIVQDDRTSVVGSRMEGRRGGQSVV